MDRRIALVKPPNNLILESQDLTMRVKVLEEIGRGATGIVYKAVKLGKDNEELEICALKEYYPILEDNYDAVIEYQREYVGENIKIIVHQAEKEALLQAERRKQRENVKREIETANKLYFNGCENSPYTYQVSFFAERGDSSYILMDTSKGKTLKSVMREKMDGKLTLKESLRYVKILLVIIDNLLNGEKPYIHGDIKPENLYIRGEKDAESMCVLDTGNAFSPEDYQNTDSQQMAEMISANDGIGCSSEGYWSPQLLDLFEAKKEYIFRKRRAGISRTERNLKKQTEAAEKLVEAFYNVDISCDLYSATQMLFYCATGCEYTGSGEYTVRKVEELTGENEAVSKWLLQILRKNAKEGYSSVKELEKDLTSLENLLNKEADPKVLLHGIKEQFSVDYEIDERLFGEIK